MARIESVKVAGFYPAPARLLGSFASTLKLPARDARTASRLVLLDPCAGEGEAILGLRDAWQEAQGDYGWELEAYELEASRARTLASALSRGFHQPSVQADAFCLTWTGPGATIAFVNAPYDTDPVCGRLEHRFLVRFTEALHAGNGYLLYLLPAHALEASATHLSQHFGDLRCWRLPEPEYSVYRQVLLVGRRLTEPLPASDGAAEIVRWARHPEELPVLEERCSRPLAVRLASHYRLTVQVRDLDVAAAAEGFDPWGGTPAGVEQSVQGILGVRVRTVLPVKPAHIALALAAGHFNGHELAPNEPERHPPILAKGVFRREDVTIDQKEDKEGNVTLVKVERPRLDLAVLDLHHYRYHRLETGVRPSGSEDLARWTAADVMVNYDGGLAEVLCKQFPPVHDPTRTEHRVALPALARTPFPAQGHAIQAALKLLALGQNPIMDAEVGAGKSTMAVNVAMALSPAWHLQTSRELARVGFTGKVPTVRRTLVVCPPHLVATWRQEILASVPDARIQEVTCLSDLDTDAEWYLLSRETAKLGPSAVGIEGCCPRCGGAIEAAAEENATKRARCLRAGRRVSRARDPQTGAPLNRYARVAELLACALRPARANSSLVKSHLPARLAQRERQPGPVRAELALEALGELLMLSTNAEAQRPLSEWDLARIIEDVALALGVGPSIAAFFKEQPNALRYAASHLIDALREKDEAPVEIEALLHEALEKVGLGVQREEEEQPCGEMLWSCQPPRRYPLAKYILRRRKRLFDLTVLDEGHEYQHGTSAQSKAAARLATLPGVPTILLSGSLCNGYASSMFQAFHMLSDSFRREFRRSDKAAFTRSYGYQKVLVDPGKEETAAAASRFGSQTDREIGGRTVVGEAPGVAPAFILRHLLPSCIVLHKADLEQDLPPITETPAPLRPSTPEDEVMLSEYREAQSKLLSQIAADRFEPELAGRLLGALVDLMSYPDRCTDDLPPYVVRYPEACGGDLIATPKAFPRTWRTPKERYVLGALRERVTAGERCIVFLTHTQTGLADRLVRLIRSDVTASVVYLDAKKVGTAKRSGWIEEQVRKGTKVLVCNPNVVRTGLNGLVAFSTAIWHEIDYSAQCWRQANGRLHRYGQKKPVAVILPFYADTAQEIAVELVAAKVGTSLQCDGLDLQAALEAAGAGADESINTALAIGQQVYRRLVEGSSTRR